MAVSEKSIDTARMGRYEVVGHLADGGMAEIVLGRILGPSGFQRPVVIKRILPHLARQKDFVEMFLDEARIVAGIRHPNVVQVHELGNEDGFLYLVMEYLEGESLAGLTRRLRAEGESLHRGLAAYIVAEACAGLNAAHELVDPQGNKQNVVHRDVSPQNIFITYDGQVKVLDFGIAVAADRVARTEAGTFKGKFEYASPEQCRGQALDRRSDIWALGVVLYEISTGTRLFKRAGQLDTLRAICEHPIIAPAEDVPGYPKALSDVIARALQRKRDARYPTAQEMRRELLSAARAMSDAEGPAEQLAALMRRLFADRVEAKADMLRRVQSGSAVTHIPAVETDMTIEIPVAHSDFPSQLPPGSPEQTDVMIPRAPKTGSERISTLGNAAGSHEQAPTPQKRAPIAIIGGAASAVLVVAIAVLFGTRKSPTPSPTTDPIASATPTASAEPSSSVVVSATVLVHIEADPAPAHVFVGGEDRGVTPLDLDLPRGDQPVLIEVKRDGFRTVEERIVPAIDQRLHVALVQANTSGPARVAHPQPQVKPTPQPPSSAKGSKYQRFE